MIHTIGKIMYSHAIAIPISISYNPPFSNFLRSSGACCKACMPSTHAAASTATAVATITASRCKSWEARRIGFMASAATPAEISAAEDESDRTLILEPLNGKQGSDVLLVFCPGAVTAAKEYLPLMSRFQSVSSLRLWIAILDPENKVVRTFKIVASWDGVIKRVKELGFQAGELPRTNVFIAGHSLGAWEARSVAFKFAQCFIQMGSCFHTNPDNLAQYPIPVLTLSGELDGQITLAAIAKHAGEIFDTESEMGELNTVVMKPVIIIPGMNHSQFSHGHPNKERGDRDAEISLDLARSFTSELVSAFLAVHVSQESNSENEAFERLKKSVSQTHILYRPFWEAINNQSAEAKEWQLTVAAFAGLTDANIAATQHEYLENFIYSKPWIDSKSRKIYIQCYLKSIDKKYEIVKKLWIKMKSCKAVLLALKGSIADEDAIPKLRTTSAAELNGKIFSRALALVYDASRRKYVDHGKKIRFVDDLIITSSGQDWIDSDITFSPAADGSGFTDVQSPVVITPTEGIAFRFAGMHYMKLLTLADAMQWILEDSFRP
ncbi:hypothetical protein O6H91_07G038800 [Diphasiastrum complanatum]|uniref:Uncharacterized protein n=1 Tax=Diphasiastrum complanatum TaxID=34168 RepID=A0ACC2D4C6_DIPCM|nr:hypothetical protein O6H91_07G038800 [Diphasiastrum complanatum]